MKQIAPLTDRIEVRYGTQTISLDLPVSCTILEPNEPDTPLSVEDFKQKLERSLTSHPLDLTQPIIVVTDKTRTCSYPTFLPILCETLNRYRGYSEPFDIVIAYGTHPPHSDEENIKLYGKSFQDHHFIHHNCDDEESFIQLGSTSSGTPVNARKDLHAASSIITMGPICHHYFAGYGGGRKLLFPGCGERSAIYQNHGLFLDRDNGLLAPGCQPGSFTANPIADDLFEIENYLTADLSIHGIQNSQGQICDVLIGNDRHTFLEGCRLHAHYYEVDQNQFDTVIISCGGYPKDLNFIQSHKAIHNGAGFVKDGGHLIVFSQCHDFIGSETFLPWFSMGGYESAFKKLSENYEGNGGTALSMMSKTRRIQISMVTSLSSEICETINVNKISADQVASIIGETSGTIGWIANASLLVNRSPN
ncbi:MAG: DUF2088 domain-containing protein [Desulfobulbaceae bacterium]|nr:MAG: DUF2088 domain-containing protein [Desulfobulbaceae bacterium]